MNYISRGEGGTMGQGEQWDSKHSRKKPTEEWSPPFASEGVKHGCACHKKVDFNPLLVFSRMLAVPLSPLSHCTPFSTIYI